jgi:hypothetical protein
MDVPANTHSTRPFRSSKQNEVQEPSVILTHLSLATLGVLMRQSPEHRVSKRNIQSGLNHRSLKICWSHCKSDRSNKVVLVGI